MHPIVFRRGLLLTAWSEGKVQTKLFRKHLASASSEEMSYVDSENRS